MNLYRFYLLVVGLSPFILYAWATSDPFSVIDKLLRLRRWARYKTEQYHGTRKTNHVIKVFKAEALFEGYSKKLINDVIKEHRERLVKQNGKHIADNLYGKYEPHPLEHGH